MAAAAVHRLYLFSGKGGVGKTTLAAATAAHLAAAGHRVLVTSIDPAHSLADVFGQTIGGEPKALAPNLTGLELDARGAMAGATESLAALLPAALAPIVSLAEEAPGVDEIAALGVLLEAMASDQFDVVIFDTAPTGHTLRFLALPGVMDGWLGRLLSVRHLFSRLGAALRHLWPRSQRPAEGAEALQGAGISSARDQLAEVRALLRDGDRTCLCLVTIPEPMGVLETERTLTFLREQGMPVGLLAVNQVQPASPGCEWCARRRELHLEQLERMRLLAAGAPLRTIELEAAPIAGLEPLGRLGAALWG